MSRSLRSSRREFLRLAGGAAALPLLSACGGPARLPTEGVPRSPFDEDSTALEVTEGVDLTGKLAVVTGCTSGIGFETMRVLAARGAYVVGTSRSLERARAAGRRVTGVTSALELELGDPESVLACSEQIRSLNAPVDMLICNAAYRGGGNEPLLSNGVERHFAVNHLGHFLLVNRLLERLYLSWQGRIVIVASRAAYTDRPPGGIRFDRLETPVDYSDRTAYATSKLANVLFARELGKRLRGTRITANAVHPGLVKTDIDRNLGGGARAGFRLLAALVGKSVEQGAATSCYVATSPLLGAVSGRYFEDCNAVTIEDDPYMEDDMLAATLWDVSVGYTEAYLDEIERPDPSEIGRGRRESSQ